MTDVIHTPFRYQTQGTPRGTTTRVCNHDGCEEPAFNVDGKYFVESRWVRVWACDTHWSHDPLREVDTPLSILAALDAEAAFRAGMRKRYTRDQPPERSESVKTLASSGWGEALRPKPRALSFHWGENVGDVGNPTPRRLTPREAMIVKFAREDKEKSA